MCVCVQYNGASDTYDKVLKNINIVFTTLFFMECILKIIAFGVLVSLDTRCHAPIQSDLLSLLELLIPIIHL